MALLPLVTFAPAEMDGLTCGANRTSLPIIGVHFGIPEIHQHRSSTWWNYDDPNQTTGHDPNMEDTDSVIAQTDNSPPVQIHQLATLLWNIVNSDREANRAILERLEDADEDLQRHPVQIFGAGDLAHLASHLAETTRTLANQEAMSDLSERVPHLNPWSDG